MDVFSDIMVIFWYFSGSMDVFSDMVIFWYFSGSMDVFSDIMVIFCVFFSVWVCFLTLW